MSAAWGWVQPAIAEETRVCSYDRAGLGWSEWGPLEFEPRAVPEQLHTLLANAREPGPYVLAGQGFGAALARLTAARYPTDVAPLLLFDAPGTVAEPAQLTQMARMATVSPWLARTGVLRVSRTMSGDASTLPDPSAGALRTFLMRPDHLTRAARELAKWNETIALAESTPVPVNVPVVTLEISGQERDAMLTNRADAGKATNAILDVVQEYRASLSPAPAP
jgi:pimeloyl-ACP methyl ester carboxylesterase